eukprot:GILK01000227.1.p1 GENE.GILK01000227.1~~GILK01000227.1.p1  ORF type:complete len:324 (-),score=99.87 GILK01000227.1:388-1359(-)
MSSQNMKSIVLLCLFAAAVCVDARRPHPAVRKVAAKEENAEFLQQGEKYFYGGYGGVAPVMPVPLPPTMVNPSMVPSAIVTSTTLHPAGVIVQQHAVVPDLEVAQVAASIHASAATIENKKAYLGQLTGLIKDKEIEAKKGAEEIAEDEENLRKLKLREAELEQQRKQVQIETTLAQLREGARQEEAAEANLRHEMSKHTNAKNILTARIAETEKELHAVKEKLASIVHDANQNHLSAEAKHVAEEAATEGAALSGNTEEATAGTQEETTTETATETATEAAAPVDSSIAADAQSVAEGGAAVAAAAEAAAENGVTAPAAATL